MIPVKAIFEDGNVINTQMNGTAEEIISYYLGQYFQFGDTDECPRDKMLRCVEVEIG